jgi:hypothetical protein
VERSESARIALLAAERMCAPARESLSPFNHPIG